jgi:hypothetical protein
MTKEQIQAIQKEIGTTPDGVWGPKSKAACIAYLRSLGPKPNPWPKEDDASMTAFFGPSGNGAKLTQIDVTGLGVEYGGKEVKSITCNVKVADSLRRVIEALAAGPHAAILKRYAGVYNNRAMRGSQRTSKHAWAVAIDLDPARNGLHTLWPQDSTMPFEVIKAFAREGWKSGGAFWGRDAMHFETTA